MHACMPRPAHQRMHVVYQYLVFGCCHGNLHQALLVTSGVQAPAANPLLPLIALLRHACWFGLAAPATRMCLPVAAMHTVCV